MGILRLLLAISVFIGHTKLRGGIFSMTGAPLAVQAFFLISGYFMFMVLTEKYRGHDRLWRFFGSRFMRLMPSYAFISFLALVVIWTVRGYPFHPWSGHPGTMQPLTFLALVASHISLLGQDVLLFFTYNPVSGTLIPGQGNGVMLYDMMLLPPAWSLSLELYFYALAPLLTKLRSRTLLALLAASILLRLWMFYGLGMESYLWTHRFFPTELALFLAGGLSYRMNAFWKPLMTVRGLPAAVCAGLFAMTISLPWYSGATGAGTVTYCFALFIALPFLFQASKHSTEDRFLGEIAYPLYLSQFLFLNIGLGMQWPVYAVLSLAVLFSALVVLLIEAPVNVWRRRLTGHHPPPYALRMPRIRLAAGTCMAAGLCTLLILSF